VDKLMPVVYRTNRDLVEGAMLAEVKLDGTISRKLGDELIDAALEAVGAWYAPNLHHRYKRMERAIAKLESLVGRLPEE
jgi:hypothetical protein